MSREKTLLAYYAAMRDQFGSLNWWPGESPFEVAVGAILTQNTAWRNVEKALIRLKELNALSPEAIHALTDDDLEYCLQPSGIYRVKSRRLRFFISYLQKKGKESATSWESVELACLHATPTMDLRQELLQVSGIGPETADSILLYSLKRPVFVVDAYTRRLFSRHGLVPEDISYGELQEFFSDVLPENVNIFNEYHALIVQTGKEFCKKKSPLCHICPLGKFLEYDVV